MSLLKIKKLTKFVRNSYNHKGALLGTTFVRHRSAGISLLVERSLNAIVNLVFADDRGRLVVAVVAVKSFEFRVVAVYAPNLVGERRSSFRRLAPLLDDTKQLVLVGDWNMILDPKIDRVEWGARGSGMCESNLIDLIVRHDLVDRFRLDRPRRETWT